MATFGNRGALARRAAAAAVAVTTASVTAACATSSGGGSGSGAAGVSDDSIKVGGVVTKASLSGFSTAEAEIGAKARFARVNAEGGVNGRKIDFIGAEDDGGAPDKGVTVARKLVQRDKVFAVVPVVAPAFGGAEYLEQQKVPWFTWMSSPSWCGKQTAFGWNGCLTPPPNAKVTQSWWGRQIAAQLGGSKGKTVYLQGSDSSSSKYGVQTTSRSFAVSGFTIAGTSAAAPAAAPPQDWSPYVNKIMKSAGGKAPDVVASIMSGVKFNTAFYAALRKAGYKGMITDATSYDPKVIADPQSRAALEGVYPTVMLAPFESNVPQVAQLKADVRKVAGPNVTFTQYTAHGYWAADIFLQILKKTGKNLTREAFLQAANNFDYKNPGFGEISYPKAKTQPNGCGSLMRVHNGAYTIAQPLKCYDNVSVQ